MKSGGGGGKTTWEGVIATALSAARLQEGCPGLPPGVAESAGEGSDVGQLPLAVTPWLALRGAADQLAVS